MESMEEFILIKSIEEFIYTETIILSENISVDS